MALDRENKAGLPLGRSRNSCASPLLRALGWHGLIEYLELWDTLSGFVLSPTSIVRPILHKICLSCFLHWFHHFQTLETYLEVLGFREMQNFYLVGCSQSLLDGRPAGEKSSSSSWSVFPSAARRMRWYSTSSLHMSLPGNFSFKFYNRWTWAI